MYDDVTLLYDDVTHHQRLRVVAWWLLLVHTLRTKIPRIYSEPLQCT